jgi:two-component system KDP operon response regulator KdpE
VGGVGADPAVADAGPGARSGEGRTILLIEDDPQIRRFLRAALPTQGFRLFEAATGEEGLIEAATRRPDVVILDLGLPDLDGLDVLRRLREWTTAPVIVLSARGQESDKIAALDAGADDYVSKPFGVGELLARLRVALRHADEAAREGGLRTFALARVSGLSDLFHIQRRSSATLTGT